MLISLKHIYVSRISETSGIKGKGLDSLTNNVCPANFEKLILQRASNMSMITKYNLFTVNKWLFKFPKSTLYRKILDFAMHNCQNSTYFAKSQVFLYMILF